VPPLFLCCSVGSLRRFSGGSDSVVTDLRYDCVLTRRVCRCVDGGSESCSVSCVMRSVFGLRGLVVNMADLRWRL
jgi:hypothetical protein